MKDMFYELWKEEKIKNDKLKKQIRSFKTRSLW